MTTSELEALEFRFQVLFSEVIGSIGAQFFERNSTSESNPALSASFEVPRLAELDNPTFVTSTRTVGRRSTSTSRIKRRGQTPSIARHSNVGDLLLLAILALPCDQDHVHS